ncbi:hypothetical protein A2U01_0116699, partial [Trifolium medium]|nr:hypothetical protein [Trifolium medium]
MESSTVVDEITMDLKAKWIIVGYALKSRLRKSEIFIGALRALVSGSAPCARR